MERLERLAREMEGSSRDLRLKSIIMGGGGGAEEGSEEEVISVRT